MRRNNRRYIRTIRSHYELDLDKTLRKVKIARRIAVSQPKLKKAASKKAVFL